MFRRDFIKTLAIAPIGIGTLIVNTDPQDVQSDLKVGDSVLVLNKWPNFNYGGGTVYRILSLNEYNKQAKLLNDYGMLWAVGIYEAWYKKYNKTINENMYFVDLRCPPTCKGTTLCQQLACFRDDLCRFEVYENIV